MEYTSLSPLAMFANAGPVGKFVMLTLVVASVYTWVLIALGAFSVTKIAKAARSARAGGDVGVLAPVAAAGNSAAAYELPGESIGEKRERIAELMSRTAREFLTQEEGGLPPAWPWSRRASRKRSRRPPMASRRPFLRRSATIASARLLLASASRSRITSRTKRSHMFRAMPPRCRRGRRRNGASITSQKQ